MSNANACSCPADRERRIFEGEAHHTLPICGYCRSMLYAAEQEGRLRDLEGKFSEFVENAVVTSQLDEAVEAEFESEFDRQFDRAIERAVEHDELGISQAVSEALDDYEREHRDDVSDAISENDLVSEREMDKAITLACNDLERTVQKEYRAEIDEVQQRVTALGASLPTTFWQRVRWMLTGRF